MLRHSIVAAALVLAACSSQPAEDAAGSEDENLPFVTANGSPAGTYEVSGVDGSVSIVTINADGTYSQITPEGEYPSEGMLEVIDGKTCFKVRAAGAEWACYTETARSADGSYTATADTGELLTVKPMPAEEAATG